MIDMQKEITNPCPECGEQIETVSGPGSREDDYEIVWTGCLNCGYEVGIATINSK